jgi:hypothetical protein
VESSRTDASLELRSSGKLVFSSYRKWLHPLLELEEFLGTHELPRSTLSLRDKIVGRAAALLIVRLGIPEVYAGILSRHGLDALRLHGVRVGYDELVERIACQTEDLLADVTDPEEAHELVIARARRARERSEDGTRP